MIRDAIYKAGYTFDELCRATGIPASTLSDIMSGKVALSHCQARTIKKLAHGLGLSMDELMKMDAELQAVAVKPNALVHKMLHPNNFRTFRSKLLSGLAETGDEAFIEVALTTHIAEDLYAGGSIPQALYTIGLIDYLCDKHHLPRLTKYDKYRGDSMEKTVYAYSATEGPVADYGYFERMIPQLLKFNFIETPESIREY